MKVVSYKCPQCMAPMEFDIGGQMWHCKFCGNLVSQQEMDKIEAQTGSEEVEKEYIEKQPGQAYGSDAVAYVCPSCGGQIITDAVTAATFCVYCHNPTVIASHLENEHQPEYILPFKVKREEAANAMLKLCKRKPLLPRDFLAFAKKGEVGGLYVPFWLYDFDMQGQMSAWGKQIQTWSDSHYNYTKTDIYAVERAGEASFSQIPADGSKRMDDQLMDALEPFDYSQMVRFSMPYLSGHFAESFDVNAEQCFQRADARAQSALQSMMRTTMQYTSVDVTHFQPTYKKQSHKNVMLPVWTLSVTYKGNPMSYAMNGQSAKMVGKLPISKGRVFVWLGALSAATALVSFLIMTLLHLGGAI